MQEGVRPAQGVLLGGLPVFPLQLPQILRAAAPPPGAGKGPHVLQPSPAHAAQISRYFHPKAQGTAPLLS